MLKKGEKRKAHDVWPSMVTHIQNLCSAFNPSKCTHTAVNTHTHTVNTHPEQWAAIYVAAPGEQLGARCLAQGHLSRGIEGGERAVHSLHPPTIPAGPETRTRNLWATSLALYPLGHTYNAIHNAPHVFGLGGLALLLVGYLLLSKFRLATANRHTSVSL